MSNGSSPHQRKSSSNGHPKQNDALACPLAIREKMTKAALLVAMGATRTAAAVAMAYPVASFRLHRRKYRTVWKHCLDVAKDAVRLAEVAKVNKSHGPRDATRKRIGQLVALVAGGSDIYPAARTLGISNGMVSDWLKRHPDVWRDESARVGIPPQIFGPDFAGWRTRSRLAFLYGARIVASGFAVAEAERRLGFGSKCLEQVIRRHRPLWNELLKRERQRQFTPGGCFQRARLYSAADGKPVKQPGRMLALNNLGSKHRVERNGRKTKGKKGRGGRPRKWGKLYGIIVEQDSLRPKPKDAKIAGVYNGRFGNDIARGAVARATAATVKYVRRDYARHAG
jgi:GNAT superfamily N-acetyltransferase